jgi:signal recognition particle receptor subunit beta
MGRIDHSRRELQLKIVYAGPGLSGKTTNLRWLYRTLPDSGKGRLVCISNDRDRTLFFDFLPVHIPNVAGFRVRLSLFTVPGQDRFRLSQALILRDADAIVFVADSDPLRMEANLVARACLAEALRFRDPEADPVPRVVQYNKRDLPARLPIEELEERLNAEGAPFIPAIASTGMGVSDSLKEVTRRTVKGMLSIAGPPAPTSVRSLDRSSARGGKPR